MASNRTGTQTTDPYRALQRRIDELPVPFPPTESGVELRLLRALFTEEEVTLALGMSAVAEPASVIAKRVAGMSEERADVLLQGLASRGAIASGRTRVGRSVLRTYGLAPLVVGMFEFQVNRLTPEYVRDFHQYLDEGFRRSVVGQRTGQLRTVPVRAELRAGRGVARYDDIRSYIAGHPGPFAVINCVCRQSAELLGEACTTSSTHETCLMIGNVPPHGRALRGDEVIAILDRAEREGHVLQPQNSRSPSFICCCCRDCCEVLRNARKLPRPADAIPSAHRAVVDAARCTGCRTCLKRCPMDAITIHDRLATVDVGRCIGCGLCATSCPEDAIALVRRRRAPSTPRTTTMMYLRMYLERWGIPGVLRVAIRRLLRRRI